MVGHDPRYNFSVNQTATHVVTWIKGPTKARNPTCKNLRHVPKTIGTPQEASWPKAVARGGAHQSANPSGEFH